MKISIHTLGCKVNQYESDGLFKALQQAGHKVYNNLQPADIYILNTCAVTNQSERKSRQLVTKALKLNENAKVIVMGCASQNNQKQFQDKKHVSVVMGVASKHLIPELLNEIGNHTKPLPKKYEDEYNSLSTKTRATLKIQDGCNNYCSYCLIPYLRGDSRSRPLNSIIKEAKQLAEHSNEIVVTGINTSDYKINGILALDRLMRSLSDINARIRISSLEVNVITKKLLKTLKQMPNFAPHFHLSLQSGCNKTLQAMNRKYTVKEYLKKVKLIRKYFNNPAITTDLIVGFAGETDKDFEKTLKTIKKAKFFDIHIFPYSERKGTKASGNKLVKSSVIKQRLNKAMQIKKVGFNKYIKGNLNKVKNVLIENEQHGLMYGHTEDYIKVYIAPNENMEAGKFYKIKLISAFKDGAIGEYIS